MSTDMTWLNFIIKKLTVYIYIFPCGCTKTKDIYMFLTMKYMHIPDRACSNLLNWKMAMAYDAYAYGS